MSANWQLRRVSDNTIDDDIQSLELTDTFNRFARIAQIELDDPDSVKTSEYPRGTLVELEVAVPGFFDFARRFAGFVADYQQDRNSTSLTILSHDFWIRKRTVNRSFENVALDVILQTLIEDLTPLTYNAVNVDLQSNPEISREWKGEQLETVLDEIGEISGGNEDYGANNDLEFFYQRREFESSPRNFGQGEYSSVEWSQDGKRDVNRAIIEYGEDDTAGVQIREDAQSQLDLQDKIGSDDPVVIEQRKAYPEITDPDVAADKAKQLLNGKATLLTGEVETWEAFAVTPGMVADVVDPDTGTDGEFVVAEITYRWPSEEPETIVTVADKSVATSEELINLSDDVTRVDLRDTDANAPVEQNIPTRIGALVDPTVLIGGLEAASVRLTNTARNLIRDGWRGVGNLDIAEIAIGDSNANLSRTNTSLENETFRTVVSESIEGETRVRYTADIGDETTKEVGLFDSGNNLLVRATYPDTLPSTQSLTVGEGTTHTVSEGTTETYDTIEVAGTLETAGTLQSAGSASTGGVAVKLDVANNRENELGVLTETGQTSIRDIIADNAPVLPQFYAYGSGGTQPQESDIALETELARQDLDEIVVQTASTTSQFESILDVPSDMPLEIANDEVSQLPITEFYEGENPVDSEGWGSPSGDEFSDGNAGSPQTVSQGFGYAEWRVGFDYRIPEDRVGIAFRYSFADNQDDSIPPGATEFSFNGTSVRGPQGNYDATPIRWETYAGGGVASEGNTYAEQSGGDLLPGETYTFRFEWEDATAEISDFRIDCVAIFDKAYQKAVNDFDNAVHAAGGYLDDPSIYADTHEIAPETVRTRRDVTEASVTSNWNNTDNNQFLELAIIDSMFSRSSNSTTASVSVAEADADTSIQSNIGFSAWGGRDTATPRVGFNPQSVSDWELVANPSAENPAGIGSSETRAVFPSGGDLSGQVLREAAQLTSDGTCLSRSIFSPIPESGTLDSTTTIIASENTGVSQADLTGVFEITITESEFE